MTSATEPQPEVPAERPEVREVKSAARTVEVLEFLAARDNRPVRLRELSEGLGVPRSSLHALLRTLTQRGWVRADSTGTLYGIGIRALLAGTTYLDSDPFVPLITPVLEDLREQLDETLHFGRLDGQDVVYLATRESSQYLRPFSRVGRRLPAFSTSLGKAILADLPPDDLAAHLPPELTPLTPRTITTRPGLVDDLALTRQRGYAIDNEENTLGVRCFAVPLRYLQPTSDAISASVPLARLDEAREREVIGALQQAAQRITAIVLPAARTLAW